MLNLQSNVTQLLGYMARFDSQYRFAVAKALTDTARAAAKGMPQQAEKDLDNPTPYTKAGFYALPARKDNLTAVVGVKDRQAEYLRWQVEGGLQRPKKTRLQLPSSVQVNVYGNIPRGLVKQLVRRAEQGKRVSKKLGIKAGVSTAADLFYGKPKGNAGLPAGLWKRENGRLTPLIVFPEQSARYSKRFVFYGTASAAAQRAFPGAMRSAWEFAKRTAR